MVTLRALPRGLQSHKLCLNTLDKRIYNQMHKGAIVSYKEARNFLQFFIFKKKRIYFWPLILLPHNFCVKAPKKINVHWKY